MTARRARSLVALTALAGVVVLAGCASTNRESEREAARLRWDPSPEVDTLHETPHDIENNLTVTMDENFRMLNSDLGRALLLDRPSRLTWERLPR
jgi:hypothetical protein